MIERVKRPIGGCLGCVAGLVLVVLLAYRVGSVGRLDARVLSSLTVDKESYLGSVAVLFAHLGDPGPQLVLLGVASLIAISRERPERAIAAIALVAGANLTTQILKAVLAHSRYQPLLGFPQIGSNSFPSGHATAAMSMTLAFVLVVPRPWRGLVVLLGACLVTAIGCSVISLRHHYPSDVIGGLLVALAWFFAVVACLRVTEPVDIAGSAG